MMILENVIQIFNSAYVNKPEILVSFMLGLYISSVNVASIVTISLSVRKLF